MFPPLVIMNLTAGLNFYPTYWKIKKFPTVVSNIKLTQNSRLKPHIQQTLILEKNFLKVGFMGMILPNLKMISNPGSSISIPSDFIKVARATAKQLKNQQNANLVILLSHMNFEDQKKILQEVPEIDIICGGQSHLDILPGQEVVARDAMSPGLMVQCGDHGRYVGVLKISMSNGIIDKHAWTIIPVTEEVSKDPQIDKFILSKNGDLKSKMFLARSTAPLDTSVNTIRTREAPAGKIVSSILRNKFQTDIAFQNSGGIRGDKIIPTGPITDSDIDTMFPFGNTVTILKITGKTLKELLERSVHELPAPSGAFLQTSGVKYTLDLSQPAQQLEINSIGKVVRIKNAGSRISNIMVQDKNGLFRSIQENKQYSVTTNSYLASGGDGYIMLVHSDQKVETFIKIRDVIKFGLRDMKKISVKFEPSVMDSNNQPFFRED